MGAPLLTLLPASAGVRAAPHAARPGRRAAPAAFLLLLAIVCGGACAPAQPGLETAPGPDEPGPAAEPLLVGTLPMRLEADGTIGGYGSGPGQMAYPEGVAVDDLGRLYVADTGNDRVLRFDQAGVMLGEFGGFGFEKGRFDKPRDLVVNRGLSLWVLDGENARVVKYDLEGRLIGTAVDFQSGEARGFLGRVEPGGLAGEPGGFLYLTDTAADRVLVVDPLGGEVRAIGGYGSQPGRFHHPTGVAVSGRGTLLVADGGNARLQALDPFGTFLRAWPLVGQQNDGRIGVCWLPGGNLAVAERDSSRISVMTGDGRVLARLDARGSGPGEIDHPSALAPDRMGRLYVADTYNHRVQVFRLVDGQTPPSR